MNVSFRIGLRKACHSDVDSGYSLYSTDSEDQVFGGFLMRVRK